MSSHRISTSRRRWVWNFAIVAFIICTLAVGNLYRVQENYQSCVRDYFAQDSRNRIARTEASVASNQALTQAFLLASQVIDPARRATPQEVADLRDALAAVPITAAEYDAAIQKYPYQDFEEVC